MDVEAIQEGLATAAMTIVGLNGYPSLPDAITPPTFATTEVSVDYNQTFGVGDSALSAPVFSCGVFVSRGDSASGRKLLAGYMKTSGATSIKAAIENDRTLGGACKTLIVTRVHGAYRLYTIGATDYLGATFDISVWG